MISSRGLRFLIALVLWCALGAAFAGRSPAQRWDVPYLSTPHDVVAAMLQTAAVKQDDIVYDLGSGDGRIVIAAVRDFGAKKAVGVDIDPERVAEANANAMAERVTDKVTFIEGDVFNFDFSEATVVTMYLFESVNLELRPTVLKLKPGTRVVSHRFSMGDWEPDVSVRKGTADIYFWIVPAKVHGTWIWGEYRLDLRQEFQRVSGTLRRGGMRVRIERASLVGDRLRFDARLDGRDIVFVGRVSNRTIHSTFGGRKVEFRRAR